MSGKNMVLDVIVRLRDKLSGSSMRRLTGNINKIGNVARKIGLVGAALGAISFLGPIQQAASFEQKLLDIAGTAGLTGKEAFAFSKEAQKRFEDLALEVGQTSTAIVDGAGQMIAAGLDPTLVDQSLGAIGRAATGANAEFSDMSAVAISLLQTLKLPAGELEDALGGLVKAGKEGAFELKDMARFFPTLTSQAAKFDVTGREAVNFLAAALQIARKGTSDPGAAANNLKNFLSKILAPDTIKKFGKLGVDIQAVMQDATTKGINPIEAVLQKISKLTGVTGNEINKLMQRAKKNGLEGADALGFMREQLEKIYGAGRLGKLFQDQQVLDFLIPFMANIEEFKRIKAEVAGADRTAIAEDFDTQMQGINRQLTVFRENLEQITRSIGNAFAPWLSVLNKGLKWLRDLNEQTGGLASTALTAGGGLVVLATGIGALGLALPIVTAGFGALAALLGLVLSPIGLVVAALVAGAVLVWKHWDKIAPRLQRIWDGLKRGLGKVKDAADDFGRGYTKGFDRHSAKIKQNVRQSGSNLNRYSDNIRRLGSSFAKLTGLDKVGAELGKVSDKLAGMIGIDTSKFNSFGEAIGELQGWLTELGTSGMEKITSKLANLTGALADVAEQRAAGKSWREILPPDVTMAFDVLAESFERAIEKIKELFNALVKEASTWPGRILAAIGNIDLSGLFTWPSLPSWLGGSSAKAPPTIQPGTGSPHGDSITLGKPANSNIPGKQSRLAKPTGRRVAAAVAPVRQEVAVGGAITIKVDGPGKVTAAQSTNKDVPINRGRAVGRV